MPSERMPATVDEGEAEPRRGRPPAGQDPAKRKQIIEGARRAFINLGFDAASMNDVTREAGVSKGTIYVYFSNKEELFEALIEEERCAMFDDLFRALDNPGGDLRETLILFGLAYSSKMNSETVILAQRIVIGAAERIPELGRRFYEGGPKYGHQKVVAFLEKEIDRGILEIPDVNLAAYQFKELCTAGFYRQRLLGFQANAPSPEKVRKVVTSAVDIFLKAYGTDKLGGLR